MVPPDHTSLNVRHEHCVHLFGDTKNVELRSPKYWSRFYDKEGNWKGKNWVIFRGGKWDQTPENLVFRRPVIRVSRVRTGRWFEWGSGLGRVRYWAASGSVAIWLGPVDPTWGSAL